VVDAQMDSAHLYIYNYASRPPSSVLCLHSLPRLCLVVLQISYFLSHFVGRSLRSNNFFIGNGALGGEGADATVWQ